MKHNKLDSIGHAVWILVGLAGIMLVPYLTKPLMAGLWWVAYYLRTKPVT